MVPLSNFLKNKKQKDRMVETAQKEELIRLLTGTIDAHSDARNKSVEYLEGIAHVRDLVDQTFDSLIYGEELLEFSVGIICSVQPEEPKQNQYLSELEKGILASAYFLYTAMNPLVLNLSRRKA